MASTETSGSSKSKSPTIVELDYSTGSHYSGEMHDDRMQGNGEFLFPTGTRYEGEFKDGSFHGMGTLYFKDKGKFQAEWSTGRPQGEGVGGEYIYADGLEHQQHNWEYSQQNDRRFYTELCHGLKPAGRTQLVDKEEPLELPMGWYDCGDGLYNPENHIVYTYNNKFLRNADLDEHDWIVKHCRKGVTPRDQLGPNGLYQ